ncbi:mesothelin [Rhineura floridana]|uniref:mesothelin n=1 Tax=Rhineura floridana TaxID=261503 RepID=UPI002AC87A72|nr:mesothelin [Rhineura floridana]XP_061456019.1 mesothelin [Rhineura floridana]
MWRDPFRIMLQQSRLFGCIFMVGWAMVTTARAEVTLPVTGLPVGNCEAVSQEIPKCLGQGAGGLSVEQIEKCIPSSGLPACLPALSEVQGWSPEQAEAILNKLFSSGYQIVDGKSLAALGSLVIGLSPTSLQSIPAQVILDAVKVPGFAKQLRNAPPALKAAFVEKSASRSSHVPTAQLASLVKKLQRSRQKRNTGCPPDKIITKEVLENTLMPLEYTDNELRLCLSPSMVADNLHNFSDYPFTLEQLAVLKEKLDEGYPDGYPDSIVRNLGSMLEIMTPEEVKKWRFNSAETLAALLDSSPDDKMASALIQQYASSGGQFDATALNALGAGYICLLTQGQLNMIKEDAIKLAKPPKLDECPQSIKDSLYAKVKRAYSDQHNQFPEYYNSIKPYLGGAPGEDLRALRKNNVNMDIDTFMGLWKGAVMELTPTDVKLLLGKNLGDLKAHQSDPFIRDWIISQKQSELDTLGLGLTGGRPEGYIVLPRDPKTNTSRAPRAIIAHLLHVFPACLLILSLNSILS